MDKNLNLDVSDPQNVVKVLRAAAQEYYESEAELQSAWSDPYAGRIWRELAKILEAAADKSDKAVKKYA